MRKYIEKIRLWLIGSVTVGWSSDDEGGVHDHHAYRWVLVALLALVALAAVSCAPTRKACEKNYGPCGVITTDTSYITRPDTIVTKRTVLPPTIFDPFGLALFDTLDFRSGRFNAQIIHDTITREVRLPGDTIFRLRTDTVFRLRGACEGDTIVRTDTLWRKTVNRHLFTPTHDGGGNLWANIDWIVLGAVGGAVAIILIRKLT